MIHESVMFQNSGVEMGSNKWVLVAGWLLQLKHIQTSFWSAESCQLRAQPSSPLGQLKLVGLLKMNPLVASS